MAAVDADPVLTFLGWPAGKVLLLGTFHFHNPGHDAHKPKVTLDVFSEQRQREIAGVVERLAAFGPTKVAVEPGGSTKRTSTATTTRTSGVGWRRWRPSRTAG